MPAGCRGAFFTVCRGKMRQGHCRSGTGILNKGVVLVRELMRAGLVWGGHTQTRIHTDMHRHTLAFVDEVEHF